MAVSTLCRFTRDLMFEAVPYSSLSILAVMEICERGGMMSEIMDVPAPLARCSDAMSFLILKSSIAFSSSSRSFSSSDAMAGGGGARKGARGEGRERARRQGFRSTRDHKEI